jgi:hypothetical protein
MTREQEIRLIKRMKTLVFENASTSDLFVAFVRSIHIPRYKIVIPRYMMPILYAQLTLTGVVLAHLIIGA